MARKRTSRDIIADMELQRHEHNGRGVVVGIDPVTRIKFTYRARSDHIALSTGARIDLRDEEGFAFLPCSRQAVARTVARWIRDNNLPCEERRP